MDRLFLLSNAVREDASVAAWFASGDDHLRPIAERWFDEMRHCGSDVDELLHDGHPTACVKDAAFAYVNAFTSHVNVGFFHGAALDDPAHLLEGSGKRMRHVKIRPGEPLDEAALIRLIAAAYQDIHDRLDGAIDQPV